MALPNSKNDDLLLKNLVPLNTLSDKQLRRLLSRIEVEKAKKGTYLFREGDTDHQNVYLLSGMVALLSGQKEIDLVVSGTPTARFALAHQLPRKHSARAKTAVTFVRVDSRRLSDLLARSQSASYEVSEVGTQGKNDWMSLLLQSSVFQQIPPANLQRVMMRMREVKVSADDVIIQQGDEGDYFYLISEGMCRITRQPSADHPPVELAQLKAGQGFGEESLISDQPRSSTVTMLTDGVLVRLSKEDFVELVKQPLSRTIEYAEACNMAEGDTIWLDVRAPEEYEAGHLPGAINLPFYSLRFQASSLAGDRAYLVYGVDVGQSATAAYLLIERGHEVFIIDQGWDELAPLAGIKAPESAASSLGNVIDFNRDAEAIGDMGAVLDAPQDEDTLKTIENLQQQLLGARQDYAEKQAQHRAEFSALQQALDDSERKLELQEQESDVARNALVEELENLRASLKTAQEAVNDRAELSESKHQLSQQLAEHQQQLAGLQDELNAAAVKSDQVQSARDRLQAELESIQQQHDQAVSQLQEELAGLRSQLDTATETLKSREQQEIEQAEAMGRLRERLEADQQEAQDFRRQVADDLAEQEGQRNELQQQLEAAQSDSQMRQTQAAEAMASLQDALAGVQAQLQELQSEKEDLVAEREQLQQTVQRIQDEAALASEQATAEQLALQQALEDRRTSLESELEALRKSGDDADSQHQHTLDALHAELAQSRESIDELREKNRQLELDHTESEAAWQTEQAETAARIASLEAELDFAQKDRETSEGERQAEIERLEASLTQINQAVEEKSAFIEQLEEENRRLSERQAQLDQLLEQEQQTGAGLSKSYEDATAKLEQLSQQLSEADAQHQAQLTEMQGALANAQSETQAGQEALEETRSELHRLEHQRTELAAQLEQQYQTVAFLKRSLETAEEAVEITNQTADEASHQSQEGKRQLQELQEVMASLEAEKSELGQQWAATQAALETAEASQREATASMQQRIEELEQALEVARVEQQQARELHAELAAKQQAGLAIEDEKAELEQQLADARSAQAASEASAREAAVASRQQAEQLQQTLESLREELRQSRQQQTEWEARQSELDDWQVARSQLESRLEDAQSQLERKIQAFDSASAEQQLQIEQLETELAVTRKQLDASSQAGDQAAVAVQELQAAQQQISELQKTIEGLSEVQLEMENQFSEDSSQEIQALRATLEMEEKKRRKVESLAQQADVLRRERDVQETAVEMLGEDLENLEQENQRLKAEKEALARQLSEMRGQLSQLMDDNNQLHSEMTEVREQAGDSHMADDLLSQLEELRYKAENFEQGRDEAQAQADRMKREVLELRSVIETYVEQIKDVQSFDSGDELSALRTELDMVRRQASEDLEQMRQQLARAASKNTDSVDREVNEAASLQALRQEINSQQVALSEKEHLLRLSQSQSRTLEDAIEDRDKEVDQLRRKLELLLSKAGGLGAHSLRQDTHPVGDSRLLIEDSEDYSTHLQEGLTQGERHTGDKGRTKFGRLFRKK